MTTWVTPITWANGAVTAAQMNSLRDNLNWLKGATAQAGITSDVALPLQTARFIGGGIHSAGQSPTTGVTTVLSFDTDWGGDPGGLHDPVTNNARLTIPAAAASGDFWVFGCQVQWQGNATGYRHLFIRLNGAANIAAAHGLPSGTEALYMQVITQPYSLNPGDYVDATVFQTSGGALAVSAVANLSPIIWGRRL